MSRIRNVVAAASLAIAGGCTVFPTAPMFAPTQVLAPVNASTHAVRPGHVLVVVRFEDAAGAREMRGRLVDPDGGLQSAELRLAVPAGTGGVVAWEVALVPGRTRLVLDRAYSEAACGAPALGGANGEHVGTTPYSVNRHAVTGAAPVDVRDGQAYFYGVMGELAPVASPVAMNAPDVRVATALHAMRPGIVVAHVRDTPPPLHLVGR